MIHECEKCKHKFDVEPVYEEVGDCESGPRVECVGVIDDLCLECGYSIYGENLENEFNDGLGGYYEY